MAIYTRTGDKGKTSLFDGTRVFKSHMRVETYGTIDELNATIGFAIAQMPNAKLQMLNCKRELEKIQHDLLDIGSALAKPHLLVVSGLDSRIKEFETIIDELTAQMPKLKHFILPGGGIAGAQLHVARTITRRSERQLVKLSQQEEIDETMIRYINRLSDLLFTMSRFVNQKEKKGEIRWIKK